MGIIKKIKSFFASPVKMGDIDLDIKEPSVSKENERSETKPYGNEKTQVSFSETIDKFDAEFHDPKLNCDYCQEPINEGKIRFFRNAGAQIDSSFHKRCFKKLRQGRLPGQ